MERDALALGLLLVVMAVALLGLWQLLTVSARSAALVARGEWDADEPAGRRMLAAADVRLRRTGPGNRLTTWLRSAGVPLAALDLLLICTVGALVVFVVGQLFLSRPVALAVALLVVYAGARTYVERKRAQRRDAFVAQLPEVARMLSNGTSAGLSMAGAVELAARELDDPAGAEMRAVLEEMRLGRALDESLEDLRRRLPSREVAVLMTTIAIQQRAGGDTVRALQELGATLEARKDLLREIRTLLSGSVYTSYVVAGIGLLTVVAINALNPGVMREMTSSFIGLLALFAAGVLWAVAFVLIRQTTKVEV